MKLVNNIIMVPLFVKQCLVIRAVGIYATDFHCLYIHTEAIKQ